MLLAAALYSHWLFVSDIHLNPYANATQMYEYVPGDTPYALWESSVREMRSRVHNPAVIVLGGDMLAHHFAALARKKGENPQNAALAVNKRIARDLGTAFPRAQFVVALGNNDDPCGDYRSETGGPYQTALARIWQPLVDRNGAAPNFIERFAHGGYYVASAAAPKMRVIVLNSVLWSFVYRGSCAAGPRDPGAAEIAWLKNELSARGGRPAAIVMHVPPGYDATSTTSAHRFLAVPFLNQSANRSLLALLSDEDSRVEFALAAHVHRYDFRVAGGVPMLIASSISPVYRNNPAFFELEVDRSGVLHDVIPHVYDLQQAQWTVRQSFDAMYGIDRFSAANLQSVSARLGSDASLRQRWIEAYDVWAWRMGDVTDHSWRVYWCTQVQENGGYASCAGTEHRFQGVVAAIASLCIAAIAAVALFVRWRLNAAR